MKPNLLTVGIIAGFLALAATSARSGPLQRGDVGANAVWVLHVDCDLLRNTTLGRYLQAEMDKPEAQPKLEAFQAMFSFDLRTQLRGLTLYSMGSAPEDGVLLVYGDFDSGRLVTLARAARDARETQHKNHVIYSWVDGPKRAGKGRTYAALAGSRIIFAQREDRVGQALDVLAGTVSNLAAVEAFPQLGAVGNTSFIQAAARKLDFGSSDPNAAILRLSKMGRFQMGESRRQISASLTLEANDEEVATNMASIAQGLVALMKLQKEKPESVKIAEALVLKQEGASLEANLSLPASEFIDMIKAAAVRKAERKAAREKRQ